MAERQHKRPPRMKRDLARAAQNEREQQNHDKMHRLLEEIVKKARPLSDNPVMRILEKIEESRLVALHCFPPQMTAVAGLLRLEADICGLIVRRTAVKVVGDGAAPSEDFSAEDNVDVIYERVRERLGSHHADQFRGFIEHMNAVARGDLIEGEAEEDDDENANDP